jgi:VWFA-related protein
MSSTRSRLVLALFLLVSTLAFAQTPGTGSAGPAPGVPPSWDSVAHSNTFGEVNKPTTASDEGKVEFRTESILIQVPVVVADKKGNHIHGLTKDDFRISENNKDQKISTFEELVATNTKIFAPLLQPNSYSNVAISGKEPRAVTVIAIDEVNTPYLDQAIGRHELVRYLANNLDTSQVLALMIITSNGVKVVQGPTGDPEQLAQILKKVSGEMPQNQGTSIDNQANAALGTVPVIPDIGPGVSAKGVNIRASLLEMQAFQDYTDTLAGQFQQARAIETTLNSFLGIAWSLSGVPGRKSLIWLTSGFPFVISAPDVVPGNLAPLYERMMKVLTDGQISVYPVDVRGITTRWGEGEARATTAAIPSGSPSISQMNNRSWLLSSTYQSLDEIAEMTGGKAFYNTNDLASSFKRAADDSSSYYLLGYYLDTKNNRSGWRTLKVGVQGKDVEIRARKGFFVTRATMQPATTRDYDLQAALSSPVEATGVPVTLKWTGISGEGNKKKAAFQVQIPANGVSIEAGDRLNFDIAVTAYQLHGNQDKPVLTFGQTVDTVLAAQQLPTVQANGVTVNKAMDIGPGQYAVRLVVRDSATGRIGSVTAPLTVGDGTIMCRHTGHMSNLKDCGVHSGWYTHVFIGWISAITPIENDEKLVQIIPEEVFSGKPALPLTVRTSQGACLPDLVVGDRWLFYFRQEEGKPILLDYDVNDSLPAANAKEEIEILHRLKAMRDEGIVRGHVLRGELFDGTAVPNARIVARRKSDRREFVTRTDGEGSYEFDPLPPGEYKLTVKRIGTFKPHSTDLELTGGACWDLTIANKGQ